MYLNTFLDTKYVQFWKYFTYKVLCRDQEVKNRLGSQIGERSKRSVGRPHRRWVDDIKKIVGKHGIRQAQDRRKWKIMKNSFIQEWEEETSR